jgi:hypothetical protein
MANLNLSEFTEKTFVADADWTFVWDTASAISKKVSRNNWLNSGELTTSAPVTISQTWNAVAQTFKALVVNAAGTSDANSASGSLLLDLQVGGVSKLSVLKNGDLSIRNTGFIGTPNFLIGNSSSSGIYFASGDLRLYVDVSSAKFAMSSATTSVKIGSNYSFGWSGSPDAASTPDTILVRDSASGNTLALRNGTAPQTFNVYGTFTTATTNFERLAIKYNATDVAYQIAAEKGTTNGDYRPLDFVTGGSRRMTIGTTGNVGIGTTAPSQKLEVAGNGRFTGALPYIDLKPDAWATPFYFQAGVNSLAQFAGDYVAFANPSGKGFSWLQGTSTARMVLDTTGNLGIGTTAPSSKLQVSAGDVEVDTITKGVILKSPDGTRYRVTVANGGTLSVAAV